MGDSQLGSFRKQPIDPPRLTSLPSGGGKISVSVIGRKEQIDASSTRFSTQFVIDYAGVANPATVTGLDVRRGLTPSSAGISVVDLTSVLAASPAVLSNGSGKIVRQGPELDFTALTTSLADYSIRIQLDNGDTWLVLGSVIPVQTELVALAGLTPATLAAGNSIPANTTGAGALTASIARDATGAIASAEIRFDLRYRTAGSIFAPSSINKVDIHLRGAGGPVVLDAGTAKLPFSLPDGTIAFPPRQIDAASNSADVQVLESLIQDPTAYYFDVHTDRNPTGEIGGILQRTENFRLLVHGDPADGAPEPGIADSLVTVNALRDAKGYVAGLVTFDFLYRNFNPGAIHRGMTTFNGASELTAEPLTFDALVNDLVVRSNGIGGLSLSVPLLGDSPLLASLVSQTPATFGAILNTTSGGVVSLSVITQDFVPGVPSITTITPAISTPGSIISIAGNSLSANPQLYIGGYPAALVEPSSPNKIVARVPPDIPLLGGSLNTPVFVVDGFGRASNNLPLGLDIAEPYIVLDSNGAPGLVDALTKQTVSQTAPIKAGNTLEIQTTGLSAAQTDHSKISSLLGISVKLDGVTLSSMTTVTADPTDSGYWKVTVQVPASTTAGKHSLQLVGTVTVASDGVLRPYLFPSATVELWTGR